MRGGEGVQAELHAGGFEVGVGAVGEVAPVGDLAGDVVGDAADGEVRVGVGDDDGDVGRGVEFAGAQGGADAGVAAADGDEVGHRVSSVDVLVERVGGREVGGDGVLGGRSGRARRGRAPGPGEADDAADELGGDERGTEAGAMPAKVSVKTRPMVTAGLANEVEDGEPVGRADVGADRGRRTGQPRPVRARAKISSDQPGGGDDLRRCT